MYKYLKYVFLFFTITCIIFIWYRSSLDGFESSMESREALNFLNMILSTFGISENVSEFALRKMAHFLEFSGLGFLLTCDVYLWNERPSDRLYIPFFVGLITGCIDETIQIFSPGRSSKVTDVWVDFAGIVASVIVTCIIIRIIFKINIFGRITKNDI